MARDGSLGRRLRRPDVRVGHAADRGGADRRRCGAGAAARAFRVLPLARARPGVLAAAGDRGRPAARPRQDRRGPDLRLRCRPRSGACRGRERREGGTARPGRVPALPAGVVAARAGRVRAAGDQSPLRRAARGRRRPARAVCAAGREAQGRLRRLAGGGAHRQPAARPRARDRGAAQPSDDERRDRVPAAAPRRDARAFRAAPRAGEAAAGRPGGADAPGRADVRQPPGQEPQGNGRLGAARGRVLLPGLRRRHAGVRVRDRPVPVRPAGPGRALALRAGVRRPVERGPGAREVAPRGGAVRPVGGDRCRTGIGLHADPPAPEGCVAVRQGGRARRVRRRGGGRPEVPGELHRLPRHRAVPGLPAGARAHPRAGARQALPQPVRLHGHLDLLRGFRRRREHDHPRPVAHLPGLGAAQPRAERPGRANAYVCTGGLPRMAGV